MILRKWLTLTLLVVFTTGVALPPAQAFEPGCDGGYDAQGYDRDGYDRDGYDRQGHDHEGYDRLGYDGDGYDRRGYDIRGYDREGYDGSSCLLQPLFDFFGSIKDRVRGGNDCDDEGDDHDGNEGDTGDDGNEGDTGDDDTVDDGSDQDGGSAWQWPDWKLPDFKLGDKTSDTAANWPPPNNDGEKVSKTITWILGLAGGALIGWQFGVLGAIVGGGIGLLAGTYLAGQLFPEKYFPGERYVPRVNQINFPYYDIRTQAQGSDGQITGGATDPNAWRFRNLAELQSQYWASGQTYKTLLKASDTEPTALQKARDDYQKSWKAFMDAQKAQSGTK